MAILKIARMGHPILKQVAEAVKDPSAAAIHRLIGDMLDTLEDAQGAGLAAPQVHCPLRLVVFHVPPSPSDGRAAEEGAEGREVPLTVLINPEIEILGDSMEEDWEGCLSVPGLRGLVPRYTHIRYSGVSPEGSLIEREARGFHARVVQHECDHLDGILYPQRMTDLSKLIFESEVHHAMVDHSDEEGEDL